MAIQIPIITEFIDQGLKDAKSAFGNFKTAVKNAEGAMGKFKAGSTVALDTVKANAGAFAASAATSIATFGWQALTTFQDLALEAGDFASKTGLAVDDASRWKEVAGDLGINGDAIATAIGKMNREIAGNPKLVKNLGDDIKYTDDKTVDVNATFLNLIQHLKDIKDPTERAKEGAKLFGKSWQNIAGLIDQGADKILTRLQEVSDAKIISQSELDKARQMRDFLDGVKDKGEDLVLTVGGGLVDSMSRWERVGKLAAVENSTGLQKYALQVAAFAVDWAKLDFGAFDQTQVSFANIVNQALDLKSAIQDDTTQADKMAEAVAEVDDQWKILTSSIRDDMTSRDIERQFGAVKDAAAKAFGGTREDVLAYQDEVDKLRLNLADMGDGLDIINQKKVMFLIDTGKLQEAYDLIRQIRAGVDQPIQGSGLLPSGSFAGRRALGGPVMAGGSYLVGENGPEIFTPGSSGSITPNGAIGGNITVNVSGADPNAVVRALQQYVRQSGPVPVNTRAM